MSQTPAESRWFALVEEFEGSGETKTEFCGARQLNVNTFTWYRSRWLSQREQALPVPAAPAFVELALPRCEQPLRLRFDGRPFLRARAPARHRSRLAACRRRCPVLIPHPTRILVATEPVDFRLSIDGLAALVELQLHDKPLSGTLFVFTNRRRCSLKLLVWDHGGFVLVYKKLERGRFRLPKADSDRVTVSAAELLAILEGIDLSAAKRLPRWNPQQNPIADS